MANIEKALIVGAGIGGLGAGAMLAKQGIETEIIEIKPEAKVFGVGINQPGNSLRALKEIGVLDEILDVGVQYNAYGFFDYNSKLIVEVPSRIGGDGIPNNCALPRRELHRILIGAADRAGAVTRYGTTVAEYDDSGDRAAVTFSDGSTGEYDLVVGYDGIKSDMRHRLFGDEYLPKYTGFAVWRVTIPRPEHVINCDIFQAPDSKAGYIPLTKETMYLFLVIPEPEGLHYDPADFPEMLRERLEPYNKDIGDIRDGLKEGDDIVMSPLSEVLLPPPWHKGRCVIAGDAAHACTPHITQGAGMALEDAVVLADELGKGADRTLDETLTVFAERRYPRAKFVQDVSRGILEAEMAVTAETLPIAAEHMAEELPGQFAQIDAFLAQPA